MGVVPCYRIAWLHKTGWTSVIQASLLSTRNLDLPTSKASASLGDLVTAPSGGVHPRDLKLPCSTDASLGDLNTATRRIIQARPPRSWPVIRGDGRLAFRDLDRHLSRPMRHNACAEGEREWTAYNGRERLYATGSAHWKQAWEQLRVSRLLSRRTGRCDSHSTQSQRT